MGLRRQVQSGVLGGGFTSMANQTDGNTNRSQLPGCGGLRLLASWG